MPDIRTWLQCICSLLAACLFSIPSSQANPADAYQQAINMAAQGHEREALAALHVLQSAIAQPSPTAQQSTWNLRSFAAQQLINIKLEQRSTMLAADNTNPYLSLAANHIRTHPLQHETTLWPITLVATLLPGAGHAWQGRWHDAYSAALIVWPMILLTLWALKRRMGPVTVFFALITIWLWSGTVFSAISLAERGSAEAYIIWWQSIWLASGLPGRPW